MKNFGTLCAAAAALLLSFSLTGCKDDADEIAAHEAFAENFASLDEQPEKWTKNIQNHTTLSRPEILDDIYFTGRTELKCLFDHGTF